MIEKTGDDLVVIADNPQEMAEGQVAIIKQVEEKQREAQEDYANACVLVSQCKDAGLNAQYATRLQKKAESRNLYLSKVKEALEAGYVIMPNFPARTIAIRVKDGARPKYTHQVSTYGPPSLPPQDAHILPANEGQYVNPNPTVSRHEFRDEAKKETRYHATSSDFSSEIGLPIDFLKPQVVQMTGKALSKKIFDEICIVDNVGVDPLVIGRVIDRKKNRTISFLVAWFVDTKDI